MKRAKNTQPAQALAQALAPTPTVLHPAPALLPLVALHGLMHILATTLPALSPLVKQEFCLTNTAVGVLSFAFAAAIGLGSVFSGLLSDRFDGLRLVSLGLFFAAFLSALLFVSHDLLSLTLIFVVMGFCLSLYHPSSLSYIAKSVKTRRGRAFGVHETGASLGLAVTPLLAGLVCLYAGWRFVYLFWAFPTAFFAILLLSLSRSHSLSHSRSLSHSHSLSLSHNHKPTEEGGRTKLTVFLRQIASTGSLRRIYLIEGLFGFVVGGSLTFIPIFFNEALGVSPALAVVLTCVFTAGGAVGKFAGGHFSDLVGERRVMAFGFFLTAPFFFVVPFLPLFGAVLALALAGLIFPTVLPAIISRISKEVPRSRQGVAFGLLMFAG
ncbi:MAG TPA: MFS transporter, partial [Methanomicrobia archaeon]|nr:MFS transporter [Methanomicrobia archaeon]